MQLDMDTMVSPTSYWCSNVRFHQLRDSHLLTWKLHTLGMNRGEQASSEASPFFFSKQKSLKSLSKQKSQVITKGTKSKTIFRFKICELCKMHIWQRKRHLKCACAPSSKKKTQRQRAPMTVTVGLRTEWSICHGGDCWTSSGRHFILATSYQAYLH